MRAERDLTLLLLLITTHARFEPLIAIINKGDQSDRGMADHGRHAGDVVVTLFWLCPQNSVFTERT